MSECCSRVAAESGSISVRAATHQAHGLGSFPWNKIFELGNKVVRPLQTLISLVGGAGPELVNPSGRRALAVRENLLRHLKELKGLLELDHHVLPQNERNNPPECAISSIDPPALPDYQLLGINQEVWLSLQELAHSLEDLSLRLEGERALDPKVTIGLLESNIDCRLFLLQFAGSDDGPDDFVLPSPSRVSAARDTPRQTRKLKGDRALIGLTEASEDYEIPRSVLSKAWKKQEGSPGYLRCAETEGRRVYFYLEDILNFSRSRKRLKH